MPTKRFWIPSVLAAVLLGLGVWAVRSSLPSPAERRLAAQTGFQDPLDLRRLMELMDEQPGPRFKEADWRIMDRAAQLESRAAGAVSLVISRIDREEDAQRALPLARVMRQLHPDDTIIQNLPASWRKRGVVRAADELEKEWEGWVRPQ